MNHHQRGLKTLIALLAAFMLVAAACGDSGGDNAASSDASDPDTTTAPDDNGDDTDETSTPSDDECDLEGTLVISNWGDPNDQDVYAGAKERFEAKHPCVTIEDNFTPITTWSEYVNKLVADVAAGNAPDIINIAIEGLRQGNDNDLFLSLDSYLEADERTEAYLADVDPRLLESLQIDGTQYLLPNNWNNMMIWYNRDMFEAAGIERPADDWTWDDFLEIAEQLTTGDGDDKVFGFGIPTFNFGLTPWYYSNGTSQLDADWEGSNLDDPAMAEAAQFVADLIHVHEVAPAVEGTDPYQLFPAEKVAMTGAGHWLVGGFVESGFTSADVLPWPRNADNDSATVFGSSGFGIFSGSENPDLAMEYIWELTSVETGEGFNAIGASVPARQSLTESADYQAFPDSWPLFYDSLEIAQPVAAPRNFTDLEAIMGRAMGEILAGTTTAEDSFADAHQELEDSFGN